MKKTIIAAVLVLAGVVAFGQNIEITPTFGYTFAGKVDNYGRYFNVKDNILYGGILSVQIADMTYTEFSYQRNDTHGNTRLDKVDLSVEHYHVGALREFKEGPVVPFAKVSLGTTRYAQQSGGDERVWYFSAGFGAGAKIMFSEKVGLRLFTNLMMPMEFDGAGFWCGIGGGGSGCSGGISMNVPIVHWDMGAGLIINIAN